MIMKKSAFVGAVLAAGLVFGAPLANACTQPSQPTTGSHGGSSHGGSNGGGSNHGGSSSGGSNGGSNGGGSNGGGNGGGNGSTVDNRGCQAGNGIGNISCNPVGVDVKGPLVGL